MDAFTELGYLGLFIASFLAATILPLSSEVVLSSLLIAGLPEKVLVGIATLGNVLGSVCNYLLGYWASKGFIQSLLKISDQTFEAAEKRFEKYGLASLCFAWVPIIGDPLTVIAGILRISFIWFIVLVTLGKLARYIVISQLVL